MYVNQCGMAIKADRVAIQLELGDLENALQTVIQRQIGNQIYARVSYNDDRNIALHLDENPDDKKEELRNVGYSFKMYSDMELAMRLMFESTELEYHYDFGESLVIITMPFQEYIEKVFQF